MTVLLGADSDSPRDAALYTGKDVWGVYVAGATPFIWPKADVLALKDSGITGVLPIVVPTQSQNWWMQNNGTAELAMLVNAARSWGVPRGAPLVLDLEEGQTSLMGSGAKTAVSHEFAAQCALGAFEPWIYANPAFHALNFSTIKWQASWVEDVPVALPSGFAGWQYKGGTDELPIDLNIFEAGRWYMSPDLNVQQIGQAA